MADGISGGALPRGMRLASVLVGLVIVGLHLVVRPLLQPECPPPASEVQDVTNFGSRPLDTDDRSMAVRDAQDGSPPAPSSVMDFAKPVWRFLFSSVIDFAKRVWLFLFSTWPTDVWHFLALVALLVSLFSASVLYFMFPFRYRLLTLGKKRLVVLQYVFPTIQNLAVVVAVSRSDQLWLHFWALFLYLGVFCLWDALVLTAEVRADISADKQAEGRTFRGEVEDYATKVDVPSVLALAFSGVLYWIIRDDAKADEGFIAGVLCFQATAAAVNVLLELGVRAKLVARMSRIVKRFGLDQSDAD